MKIQLVYLTLWSLSEATYISRMTVNSMRVPTAFHPGVILQQSRTHPRLVQAASHITPYDRNPSHRYAMKQNGPNANRLYINSGRWETPARLPLASVRINGVIHTIPAPKQILSEKPMVVFDGKKQAVKVTSTTEVDLSSTLMSLLDSLEPIINLLLSLNTYVMN